MDLKGDGVDLGILVAVSPESRHVTTHVAVGGQRSEVDPRRIC